MRKNSLAVIDTHPVQYRTPVYRVLEQQFNIPVTAIYGSDFSIMGYHDKGFDTTFAWDTELLSGYSSVFLSRVGKGLGKTLTDINPKAVMIVGYSPFFHQAAFYQAWRRGYPIIFRGETTDHTRRRKPFERWLRDRALNWIYQRCAKLLYIGQRSLQHFKRLGCPAEKLIFSPYCVDTTPFQCGNQAHFSLCSSMRRKLGITEKDKVLLFSGKLNWRKGPDLLLNAAGKMPPNALREIVIIFLGNGQMRNYLENFAKKEPRLRVHFVGFKNQSELTSYYQMADLLVLSSRFETWGVVINEALHHGLPSVVSEAVGCMPDLIKPGITGEIFKTNSVSSLISSMERAFKLIGKPGVKKACREIMENYTVEKAAEGIREAYREL